MNSDSPIDGGGHEGIAWTDERLHLGQRDGSSLINHHQLSMAQFAGITWLYVLRREQNVQG